MRFTRPSASAVYVGMLAAHGLGRTTAFTLAQVYLVSTVGLDALQLVLVGTVMELTVFLFEVPTGVVADTYSRKLSILIGYGLTGGSYMLIGSIPLFVPILFSQIVWGLGWTFISGARQAWIADEIGVAAAAPIYVRGTQAALLGSLIGIPVAVVVGWTHFNFPFFVAGGLMLALVIALAALMPEEHFKPSRGGQQSAPLAILRDGLSLIRGNRALLAFIAIALFLGLYSEGYDRLSQAHLIRDITLPQVGEVSDALWFGLLRMGTLLLALGATQLAGRRIESADGARLLTWLRVIYGAIVVGLLVFAFAPVFVVALLAMWIIDSLRATAVPIETAWVNRHIDSRVRATVLSTFGQVDALGEIVSGPIVGLIGLLRSVQAAIVASALLLAPVVPLFGRAAAREPEPEV